MDSMPCHRTSGLRVATLLKYLGGNRRAILEFASCRQAVWLGLVWVLSAGLAREYDGEDLLHAPWHALLPLGASLVTSLVLFVLLEAAFPTDTTQAAGQDFRARYRAFLGLYWLTAPLAWLYAIPVERFLGAADAVRVNLGLLAMVSVWRVALMTRVAAVVYGQSHWRAFFLVLFFADSVAMVVSYLTPMPIVTFMGGIRLTESESVIQATVFMIRFFGTVTWPLWLIGALVAAWRGRQRPRAWGEVWQASSGERPVGRGLQVWAVLSLLVWVFILPFTQREQIHRRFVERALRANRIEAALEYMSQRKREDFPPHWDPPPRLGYGETRPSILAVLFALDRPGVAPWVQALFRQKLAEQAKAGEWNPDEHAIRLRDMDDGQLAEYARVLSSLPEGPALASYHATEILRHFEPDRYGEKTAALALSEQRRAAMEKILRLVPGEEQQPEPQPAPQSEPQSAEQPAPQSEPQSEPQSAEP